MKSLFTFFAMFLFLVIGCQGDVKKSNPEENNNDTEDTDIEDATDTESTDTESMDTESTDTESTDTESTDTEDTDTEDTDTEDTDTEDTDTEDTDTEDTDTEDTDTEDTDTEDTDTEDTDTEDTDTEDTDTDTDDMDCISNDEARCYEGDLWWYDSCDNREEKKEICYHGCDLNDCLDPPNVFPWTDTETGYQWSEKAPGTKNKAGALAYCAGLGGTWRLPTISELRTLIQHCPDTETGGACGLTDDCTPFTYDNCGSGCSGCLEETDGRYSKLGHSDLLWSSSSYDGSSGNSLFVGFNKANVSNAGNSGLLSAICINTD